MHARAYPPTDPNSARSLFCGEARNERPSSSVELELQLYRTTRGQVADQVAKPGQPRTTLISNILRRGLNGTASPWAIRKQTTTGHPPRAIRSRTSSGHPQTTLFGHPWTTTDHPQADDHGPSADDPFWAPVDDHRPSASRRPRAIRKQTTTFHPQEDDLGPSASRRPRCFQQL